MFAAVRALRSLVNRLRRLGSATRSYFEGYGANLKSISTARCDGPSSLVRK